MSRPRRSARHRSREVALQALYAVDLGRGATPAEAVFEEVAGQFELPEGARAFAAELVGGVSAQRAELDRHLTAHARRWRLDRMPAVDRNILRIAAWEMLHAGTPAEVAIDEAVELARRFGSESSPAFVNGVLDALAREALAAAAERAP